MALGARGAAAHEGEETAMKIEKSTILLGVALILVGLSFLVEAEIATVILCGTGVCLATLSLIQMRKEG